MGAEKGIDDWDPRSQGIPVLEQFTDCTGVTNNYASNNARSICPRLDKVPRREAIVW